MLSLLSVDRKMKVNKNRRILILMITSQFLLTLFVIHWLWSQYRSEKEVLVKELTGFWIDSRDQVIDTLVFRNYVNPVLLEKNIKVGGKNLNISGMIVADSAISLTPEQLKESKALTGKDIITVRINHSTDTTKGSKDTLVKQGLAEDFLIRSVKMIVSHAGDTSGSAQNIRGFSLKADTAMFKKHFSARLSGAGMRLNINWEIKGDSGDKMDHKRLLLINPMTQFPFPEAVVAGYTVYLTGKIMPQIIFGILLVFITALAFALSYRSIQQQSVLNNLRNEFISNITHELKTPVATLSIALESLRRYNMQTDPVVLDEYLRLASQETKRLEELINRVLDHSMLEEHSTLLNLRDTDLGLLISEATEIMKPRLGAGGKLTVVPSDRVLTLQCDALYIKGVIINLIDNSVRYCDKEPVITISSRLENGFAVIEVNDNGPGIPVEYQSKIFEKFFRLPSENVHNVKGYGLGLSFAALVMKIHRGSISVRNLEQGCSFIIKLPVA